MKFTFNWLAEFVALDSPPQALAKLLTMAGLEVESLTALREPESEREDWLFEIAVTPNRGDCLSLVGIAREVAALTGAVLKAPRAKTAKRDPGSSKRIALRIGDARQCARYSARVVDDVAISPSPAWLRYRLEACGIRAVNNIVDATNYVMLETGQPLHAFDYHLLAKPAGTSGSPAIVVRRAADGEKFRALDNQERTLTSQMLLIADETKAVALAGVMGGQNSEINVNTKDVLIESAYFKPQNIRATSKKLELRTESSYRFERGGDIGICDWASARAAQLILETAGGALAEGVVDAYPKPFEQRQIALRHAQTNALAGIEIPQAQQIQSLQRLGLEVGPNGNSQTTVFRIPSFRVDIKREIDLVEEVIRLYGVNKIPSTPPRGAIGSNAYDAVHDQIAEARRILTGLGLYEAQGQTLISDSAGKVAAAAPMVSLANPLSSEMNVLRPSLLPGLLDALRHNISRRNDDLALFEIGRVFLQSDAGPKEERHVALVLTGQRNPLFWNGGERDSKFDIFDLKGVIEEFFDHFGMRSVNFTRRDQSTGLFLESAAITLGKFQLGELGQLLPQLAKQYDLRDAVLLAELNLDVLLARRNPAKSFKPLSTQPAIRRDVAMLVPEATTHDAVLQIVKQAKPASLESVELFDIFRGKNVPESQKSLAYAFTYRNPERSLTDAEVNAAHEKLVAIFKERLKAAVRE